MVQPIKISKSNNFFQINNEYVTFWGNEIVAKRIKIISEIQALITKFNFDTDEVIEISDDDTFSFFDQVYLKLPHSKAERYESLIPQIKSLVSDEPDLIANLANICAVLKYTMDGFFWVGFYLKQENTLVLGPFQGPLACTRIQIPKGVCGKAVAEKRTIIVDDVNQFPGHIACSTDSKSEIVIPVIKDNDVIAVLDIDSDSYSNFDDTDKKYLEQVCDIVSELFN